MATRKPDQSYIRYVERTKLKELEALPDYKYDGEEAIANKLKQIRKADNNVDWLYFKIDKEYLKLVPSAKGISQNQRESIRG